MFDVIWLCFVFPLCVPSIMAAVTVALCWRCDVVSLYCLCSCAGSADRPCGLHTSNIQPHSDQAERMRAPLWNLIQAVDVFTLSILFRCESSFRMRKVDEHRTGWLFNIRNLLWNILLDMWLKNVPLLFTVIHTWVSIHSAGCALSSLWSPQLSTSWSHQEGAGCSLTALVA